MIGYVRGCVVERRVLGETAVELVVDVGGVGYRLLVAPRVAASLGVIGAIAGLGAASRTSASEVAFSVHTHVREGAITLYGFGDAEERRAFEILLSAHGVGPSLALANVAVHPPGRLVEIVTGGDVDALMLVPGVGRKTALRLLLDLKASFGELDGVMAPSAVMPGGKSSISSDVAEALSQLGYAPEEVRAVLRRLPAEGTTEELLRTALRELAPRR